MFHSIVRLRGGREAWALYRRSLITGLAVQLVAGFVLYIGLNPDGHGRPAAWNVLVGLVGSAFVFAMNATFAYQAAKETGAVPAVVAMRRRRGFLVGSPIQLATGRGVLVRDEDPAVTLNFKQRRIPMPGRQGHWHPFLFGPAGSSPRRYTARVPIDDGVVEQAREVLGGLGIRVRDAA